jgi:hypothetical protein
MHSNKSRLRYIGALFALAALALAVSCRGFFVNPTLTAITISPSAPEVELNNQVSLTVYGTYNDGSTGQVNSGVSWSSGTPSVADFTGSTSNVLQGLSLGTTTITANAQAVTATASATVYLGGITAITISPSSGTATTNGDTTAQFTAMADANGQEVNITTQGANWTLTPSSTYVTCAPSASVELCTATVGATVPSTYTLTVSYPGTTITASATLSVPD